MMHHDPLCPHVEDDGVIYGWNVCKCDEYAKVRADERSKHTNAYERGYDQAIRDNR